MVRKRSNAHSDQISEIGYRIPKFFDEPWDLCFAEGFDALCDAW